MINIELELPAHFLDDRGRRAGFVPMVFLLSFLFIRSSARLMRSPRFPWWPGSVKTSSGFHLHHLVWGIVLLLGPGFLDFVGDASSPRTEILAGLFGVGAGLTLDEFALWIHLDDVYWAEEGRSSFDAVVFAAGVGALILLGAGPFDLSHNSSSLDTLIAFVVVDLLLAVVTIYKSKPLCGAIGVLVSIVSAFGAVRRAVPVSRWARRFYPRESRRLARSRARWERQRRQRRLGEAIAGAPGLWGDDG